MSIVNIIEDDLAILTAASEYLEIRGHVVNRYMSAEAFLMESDHRSSSTTVISFSISGGKGMRLLQEVLARGMRTSVIMLSDLEDTTQIVSAMKLGAVDVIEKPFSMQRLESAIEASRSALQRETLSRIDAPKTAGAQILTGEEEAILTLLSEGCTVKEVAAKLDVSVRTVHYRKNSIFSKISVKNRSEALRWLAVNKPARKSQSEMCY